MVSVPKTAFFSDDSIVFAPLAPMPSAAPASRRRKLDRTAAGNSFAMMMPLSMLAACGGGGGGGVTPPPGPPPSPPSSSFTGVADSGAITAGAAALTVAAPGVLGNDTLVGGTVGIVSSGQSGTNTAVTVPSGGTAVINGTLGVLTLGSTGSYSYTAANTGAAQRLGAGVTGTDVFTYGGGIQGASGTGTGTLTITVTGINDAPLGVNDTGTATRGGVATVTTAATGVLSNDTDPDSNAALTVTGVGPSATTLVTVVAGGSTVIPGALGLGSLDLSSNGSYSFTPSAGTTGGTEVFTYRVSDGAVTSTATITFTVNPGTPPAGTLGATLDITNQTTGAQVVRIVGSTGGQAELGASVAGSATAVTSGTSLLFGAPGTSTDAGVAYLVSGITNGAAQINVTSASGVTTIGGLAAGARLGTSVDLGTVNADARADVLVGAPGVTQGGVANGGSAYVLYGNTAILSDLNTAPNGTTGIVINGSSGAGAYSLYSPTASNLGDNVGALVRYLGNINGDANADFLIGAPGIDGPNGSDRDSGRAVVVYGGTTLPATSTATDYGSTLTVRGFLGNTADTATDERAPTGAASGNLNETNGGAANRDLVYTSAFRDVSSVRTDTGTAFVLFSTVNPQGGTFDGAPLNGTNGYRVFGNASGDRLGFGVDIGDVNGDGIGDVVLGAPGVDGAGTNRGAVYIIYGSATAPTLSNLDLSTLVGSSGTVAGLTVARIDGPTTDNAAFGSSIAVGDFNGDGRADIAIGADGTGDVFLVYGRGTAANQAGVNVNTPTAGVVTLLDGIAPAGANFHISLDAGFDLNGDGRSELLIGATGENVDGAAYLVFGAASSTQTPNALSSILEPTQSAEQTALDILVGPPVYIQELNVGTVLVFDSMPLATMDDLNASFA
jgi:VCBS repeat-containing protein